jgi:nucleoside-diphosphate-sugar epimerase
MRLIITGHKGYIGSVLTPMMLAAGHEVVGLDTDLFRASNFGAAPLTVPEIAKDVRDVQVKDLEGFDAVIHLAGLSNDPLGYLNPDITEQINHLATTHLATLAKAAGVPRFLFSSSCSVYGAFGDDYIDEEAEFRPVTPYGRSKVDAEADLVKLADDTFTPTYLRNATAYGVSSRLRFDLVLNNLVGWACATGNVFIKSDGTPWRPIVHIEDISRAFLAVLNAPRELVHNVAFNVGATSENYRIRELADIVERTVPGCRVEYAADGGPDKRCYRVSCEKICRVLPEYQPQWTAQKGAVELYEAFRNAGLTPEDFEGPRYSRIAHIKKRIAEGDIDSNLRWVLAPQEAAAYA